MKDHHIYFHNIGNPDTFHTQTTIDLNLEEVFNRIDFTSSAYGRQYFYKHLFEKENSILPADIQKDIIKIDPLETIKYNQILECSNEPIDFQVINLLYNPITIIKKEKISSYISLILMFVGLIGINFHFLFFALLGISIAINKQLIWRNKKSIQFRSEIITAIIKFTSIYKAICEIKMNGVKSNADFPRMNLHKYLRILNTHDTHKLILKFIELLKLILPIDNFAYTYYLNKVKKHNTAFISAFETIGHFDLITSVKEIQNAYTTCYPSYTPNNRDIQITNSYHPLIENYTPNSFNPQYKDTIITGATMSGKTTFLKQIAVNILLGQKLGICFADNAIIPTCPICTFMNSSENFLGGVSHYYSQLTRMKNIMNICKTKKHLIIIDNAFIECNSSEQVAINYSILKELSNIAFLLITTTNDPHLLQMLNNYNNYYFDSHYSKLHSEYNCEIKKGIKVLNNSINIAQEIGMPTSVVEDAKKLQSSIQECRGKQSVINSTPLKREELYY